MAPLRSIAAARTDSDVMHRTPARLDLVRILLGSGPLKGLWRGGLLVIVSLALLGGIVDLVNTVKFGQIDLRNRVVGARVMLLGQNPYTYLWQPGEPDTLLDPYPLLQKRPMAAVTVTPAVLSIHTVLAPLPYRYQKFLWFFVQVALFGGTVWLAMRRAETPETRAAVLVLGVMFSCSTFWRLHVERGQVYALFAFVTVLYLASFGWRSAYRAGLGGFVLGLLVCLRPHMAMLGVPLLVYRKWNAVLGAVLGVGIGILVPTLISKPVWPEYVQAMVGYMPGSHAPAASRPRTDGALELPTKVEGSSSVASYASFGFGDTTLKGAVRFYFNRPTSVSLMMGLLIAATIAWFLNVYRLMRKGVPIDYCSVGTLGLIVFIETVLPITRIEYSNMILLPIVLMIVAIRSHLSAMRAWEWGLLLAAWVFSAPLPPWMSAGFRGPAVGMVSQGVILLWAMFAPWIPPALRVAATDNSGELLASR
jgi:hypothetical protein